MPVLAVKWLIYLSLRLIFTPQSSSKVCLDGTYFPIQRSRPGRMVRDAYSKRPGTLALPGLGTS
jgi:hypothetical protein